jgi:hypothetical protein
MKMRRCQGLLERKRVRASMRAMATRRRGTERRGIEVPVHRPTTCLDAEPHCLSYHSLPYFPQVHERNLPFLRDDVDFWAHSMRVPADTLAVVCFHLSRLVPPRQTSNPFQAPNRARPRPLSRHVYECSSWCSTTYM